MWEARLRDDYTVTIYAVITSQEELHHCIAALKLLGLWLKQRDQLSDLTSALDVVHVSH